MSDADLLADELSLLLASIADARAEHEAGDLDDDALAAIVQRDGARVAEVRARLSELATSPPAAPAAERPRDRRRGTRLLVVAATSFAVVVAVVVLAAANPFAAAPAPLRVTKAVQVLGLLVVAEKAVAQGEQLRALTAYDAVLRLDPRDAEALIESGWLRYEQGLAQHREGWVRAGAATLRRAVVVAPNVAAAHLYDGIVLYQHDRDRAAALHQILRAGELPESPFDQSVTATFLAILEPKR
jgi:tetratricopeptide (TPR) repeat protein